MARRSGKASRRRRVGKVSYYFRNGSWHVYYREAGKQVRRRSLLDECGGDFEPKPTLGISFACMLGGVLFIV